MLKNKLVWIFTILVLLPNIIFWISTLLEKYSNIFRYIDHKGIFLFILFLPIIGSMVMLLNSIKYKNYGLVALSSVLFVFSLISYIVVYSLSNFGF